MQRADYWISKGSDIVQCTLCPHQCVIDAGMHGKCKVRENRDGVLYSLNYFVASAEGIDPVEKKPLYHFFPGSKIISVGTFGCNFECKGCQNYTISKEFEQSVFRRRHFSKEDILNHLSEEQRDLRKMCGVAYTYSEPTVWIETVHALAPEVGARGYKNVLVTNGYIQSAPRDALLECTDAWNIDLKACNEEFYKEYCGGSLQPVLDTICAAKDRVHLELTTLIIPGLNDKDEDIIALRELIVDIAGPATPVHISRYFPTYKMEVESTPMSTMRRAYTLLREKLSYVYIGNCSCETETVCANCGAIVIERMGYMTSLQGITERGNCARCGAWIAEFDSSSKKSNERVESVKNVEKN